MVVNAVVSNGVVVPVLLTVGVGLLTGCSQLQGNAAATAATARAGYCVGVDTAHPQGATTLITFKRGDVTLGEVGTAVTGAASIAVTPGAVDVRVDGKTVATMTAADGTQVYARSGTGCPPTMT